MNIRKTFSIQGLSGILSILVTAAIFTACINDETTDKASGKGALVSGFNLSASQTSTSETFMTRAKVSSDGAFTWNVGDKVSVFNFSTYYTSTAETTEAGAETHFEGQMVATRGDSIAMFYPAINDVTVKSGTEFGQLNLDISKQMGTLDDFANRFYFKFGLGRVDDVSNGIAAVSAKLQDQVALCNCKFTFKLNGETLMMKGVKITGAPSVATVNLRTDNLNGSLTPSHSTQTDVIDVTPPSADSVADIAMFPTGGQEETYTLTVTGADGNTYSVKQAMTLVAGKYYNYVIELGEDNTPECDDVRWAKSNFVLYDLCYSWNRSSYGFYCRPWSSNATRRRGYRVCDTFRWGVIGEAAWNPYVPYCPPSGDREISGKMFTDPEMRHETKDFCKARYGDIVYWATCGKLRLPTAKEMTKLFTARSWEYGMHEDYCQWPAYGFMFTCPPKGEARTTRYDYCYPKRFSRWDFDSGIFLPLASYRTGGGRWTCERYVSKYMTSTLVQGCVDTWSFGHNVNPGGSKTDWKTGAKCDARTLRSRYSPCEFVPIRAVYVDKK